MTGNLDTEGGEIEYCNDGNIEIESEDIGVRKIIGDEKAAGEPKVSKSQLKKMKKRERSNQLQKIKRVERMKRQRDEKSALMRKKEAGDLSSEEGKRLMEIQKRNHDRNVSKRLGKERMKKARESPGDFVNVILDCGFEELMGPGEKKSICSQIAFSYGINMSGSESVNLSICSLSREGYIHNHLFEKLSGFQNWFISTYEESYLNHFDKNKLVYLTADAEDYIDDLKPGYAYIIGAIADHNRYKGLTLDKAKSEGIQCGKLRIPSKLIGGSRKVLAVNHVMDIIIKYLETKDWDEACLVSLPSRKLVKPSITENSSPSIEQEQNSNSPHLI